MAEITPENIRNVVLLSHSGAGKTSLAEALLFATGSIPRLGRVDDGNTTSDYDPDEVKRKISLNLSLLPLLWREHKVSLVDTPGYADFVGEVRVGLRVAEGAVLVASAAAGGVEVGTEEAWKLAQEAGLPRLIFINKMDRENASFSRTLESIRERLGPEAFPLQVPLGAHTQFQGVADLLSLKALLGPKAQPGGIPPEFQGTVASHREKLVEAIVETDDALLAKYLEGEEVGEAALREALTKAVKKGQVVPILVGSATQQVGVIPLLEAILALLPSPPEAPRPKATDPQTKKAVELEPSPSGPLAALVFKTSADPYVGRLTYLRVFSGTLFSNSQVWNASKGQGERIGQLFLLRGKNQEPVPQIMAGDMGAVAKLSVTATNDTLTARERRA